MAKVFEGILDSVSNVDDRLGLKVAQCVIEECHHLDTEWRRVHWSVFGCRFRHRGAPFSGMAVRI